MPSRVQDILLKKILSFLHDEASEEGIESNEVCIKIVNGDNAAQFLEKIKKVVERNTSLKADFKDNLSKVPRLDFDGDMSFRDNLGSTSVRISHPLSQIHIELVD